MSESVEISRNRDDGQAEEHSDEESLFGEILRCVQDDRSIMCPVIVCHIKSGFLRKDKPKATRSSSVAVVN